MFMATLLGLDIIAFGLVIPYTLRNTQFNPLCFVVIPMRVRIMFSMLGFALPAIAFLFILAKLFVAIHEGWGRTPLMKVVVQDGIWGIVGFIGVWLINPLVGLTTDKSLAYVAHLWFMSIIPLIGCRVILNMQRLKLKSVFVSSNEFTTYVEVAIDSCDIY